MWENALTGLILENIETLRHYQKMEGEHGNTVDEILQFVFGVITSLPWYFRLPITILANAIGMLCIFTTGHQINLLSSEKRSLFLKRIQFIPFFGMLNKLVRSMAFMKLFDSLPLVPDDMNSVNEMN